ncbi:MAG: enoyl-CoA hydratase/isomerase family protein [Nevskia sp.]|nr:enoyl-CoA hydratase/isomerase family protein [Nevskia sp.]
MSNWDRLETVLFEVGDDHVATITLNRPAAMNSFNKQMVDEFDLLWQHIRLDDAIHAVVLRAAAGRAFSTGVDVKDPSFPDPHPNLWVHADPGDKLGPKANLCWKPVITAVHGLCAAGAFYWLNESDLIICSDDAQFFEPHVTYGMTAAIEPIGMTYRMPLGDVMRMALLGNDERICASTALRIGLVTEVLAPDVLWTRAHELAAKIAAKPPAAIQGTVRAIWESLDTPRSIALQTALKYTQLGNPIGMAQVDRWAIMGKSKTFDVR